jgi:HK97 gp10 family phage protein
MADSTITVTGLQETLAMLDRAPKLIVARGFLQAAKAAAAVIEEELEIRTPERDEGERNEDIPHLRDAMVSNISLDAQLRGVSVSTGFGRAGNVALWVEFGHRLVGHKPGKKDIGTVPAHPFMRPAADAAGPRAIDAFADSLAKTLKDPKVVAA